MTVYTLLSAQNVPSWQPGAPVPPQVVLTGSPYRVHLALTLNQPSPSGTQASLWAETGTTPVSVQDVQMPTLYIPPGQTQTEHRFAFNLSYYDFLFGRLDLIDPSQAVQATMTIEA